MSALRRDAGASLIDVLLVLAIVATVTGISVPVSGTVVDAGRARQAAAFVSSRFRLARIEALNKAANVGVVFDLVSDRWSIRICRDGNRNGLRRADIGSGIDPCTDGPHHFSALVSRGGYRGRSSAPRSGGRAAIAGPGPLRDKRHREFLAERQLFRWLAVPPHPRCSTVRRPHGRREWPAASVQVRPGRASCGGSRDD